MNLKIAEKWLNLVRFYTFYSPFRKGKYRLYELALRSCRGRPGKKVVPTSDGRKIYADLQTEMYDTVFFLGEYERAITDLVRKIVYKNDVCLDVGANFGWYSSLFYSLGAGEVHAFEPVLPIFEQLRENFELVDSPANVFLNNFALGDDFKKTELYISEGETYGFASISTHGKTPSQTFRAEIMPLDAYLNERKIEQVDFIKVDIEGAEMMFLKGAGSIFKQKRPPLIIMEMALDTTKYFNYKPNDLVDYIGGQTDYDFFAINEINGMLVEIEGFTNDSRGANVLCVPKNHFRERLGKLKIKWAQNLS